jgi:hypothetical protein
MMGTMMNKFLALLDHALTALREPNSTAYPLVRQQSVSDPNMWEAP